MPTKWLTSLLVGLATFIFLTLNPHTITASTEPELQEGVVIGIQAQGEEKKGEEVFPFQTVLVKITKGSQKDQEISIDHRASSLNLVQYQKYQDGDRIKIATALNSESSPVYTIDGHLKREGLLQLLGLFVIVVLVVGRVWGALSILGLTVSFLVIFQVIIPLIIKGANPVVAAVLGALIIVPTTFYISHGFNKKTHVGVVATTIGLIITGVLAVYFVNATHLTGFASEEASFLQIERSGSINIRQLLLAGIIIGTLGILDDVTVGQASLVEQLKRANRNFSRKQLFKNGMKVGQDHISSMVNTLVLVYAGSALPLLLLFFGSQHGFVDILEFELITEEVVRMLVGSIGLVLAAPLATALAAIVFANQNEAGEYQKSLKQSS